MRINWFSPLFDASGYAYVGRQLVKALIAEGHQVAADEMFQWNPELRQERYIDKEMLKNMKRRHFKNAPRINLVIPDQFHRGFGNYHVGYTMFEVDRISDVWVVMCNKMDEIFVPSSFNYHTFSKSGVDSKKLKVMPFGVDAELFNPEAEKMRLLGTEDKFVFFSDFQWSIRKGWDVLLEAYYGEFDRDEGVCLVLKTYEAVPGAPASEAVIFDGIKSIKRKFNKALPKVLWFRHMIEDGRMPQLYKAMDCFVSTTRGEGWNLPLVQAMSMEVPSIVTNWSAHTDYATERNAYLIDYEMVETHASLLWHPGYRDAYYANPSIEHTRSLMRHVYDNYEEAKIKAEIGRDEILKQWTWKHSAQRIVKRLEEVQK